MRKYIINKRKQRNYLNEFQEEAVKTIIEQEYLFPMNQVFWHKSKSAGLCKKKSEQPENSSTAAGNMTAMQAEFNGPRIDNKQLKIERETTDNWVDEYSSEIPPVLNMLT